MNERVYNSGVDRLRSPERIAKLGIAQVVDNCLMDKDILSVLDVGTGSGVFAEEFLKHGLKVSAIDPNPEMISVFEKFLPDIEIKKASAENIPFEDRSFNLVFMGLVFHEVDDYSKSLMESFRIADNAVSILEWEFKQQDFGPPIDHRLKSTFIEKLAKDTGFKKVKIVSITNLTLYKLFK